ncbi:alpha-amylase family glycosyl hydrolase [Rufibacter sp. DG15C]|uniref:DUF4961 domain-containing protein n=1 Tax=Rufibacter sp. DG15C TaxID=1379909 RepID=UPI0009006F51|nr:alpha-amylase family glycosyl hydrolase [Rufibacter sp. DG15C]
MKHTLRLLCLLWLALLAKSGQAQVVAWTPNFPTETDKVTIIFDATKGNRGLENVTTPIYAHTGVLVNNGTTWTHVKSGWEVGIEATRMVPLGNNKYQLVIDNPRAYYGVAANEEITALMFVFWSKTSTGTKEGKDTENKDIKVPIFKSGAINVTITQPAVGMNPYFVDQNQSIQVKGTASSSTALKLYVNDQKVSEATGTALEANVIAASAGYNKVKLTAENGGTVVAADSFGFVVRTATQVQAIPAGAKDGITYLSPTSVLLNLFAPNKTSVYAIGDFNNWQASTPMYKTPDGTRFWTRIDNLTPKQEYAYQYLVNESLKIADPYTEKVLDPNNDQYLESTTYPNLKAYPTGKTTGLTSVLQTDQTAYAWQVTNFTAPKKTDMVIYELLVRDFLANHNYQTLKDTLDYLSRLGINTIELMPINEFEGNLSWGYNSSFYFAPDKYYGSKDMLKRFIDEAHKRGMAVIIDMVLNHSFSQSPMVQLYYNSATGQTTPESPWFNPTPTHDYNVGHDFNHESLATKYFVDRVNEFWLKEYNIDGYRFDLSKGFTQKQTLGNVGLWGQYDQSRVDILKRMADHIWSVDPSAYVILEHLADNSEEKVLADYGMMLWGNLNHNYRQAAKGDMNNSNFDWISYKRRGWNSPHVVGYMESHDEERMMFDVLRNGLSSGSYSTKTLTNALKRMRLAAGFFFTIPGPKMIWQFGEVGYDISIDQNGRTGNKPILWEYYQDAERKKLYDVYAALIKLKVEQPAFESNDFTLDLGGTIKRIHIQDPSMNVAIVGNFGLTATTADAKFQYTGTWYDYMSGEALTVTNVNQGITLQPGEMRLYTSIRISNSGIITGVLEDKDALAKQLVAYPNPSFNGQVTLKYQLTTASEVSIQLYDQLGRLVNEQNLGRQAAGPKAIQQALTTPSGGRLAPGLYICKVITGATAQSVQIVVQ